MFSVYIRLEWRNAWVLLQTPPASLRGRRKWREPNKEMLLWRKPPFIKKIIINKHVIYIIYMPFTCHFTHQQKKIKINVSLAIINQWLKWLKCLMKLNWFIFIFFTLYIHIHVYMHITCKSFYMYKIYTNSKRLKERKGALHVMITCIINCYMYLLQIELISYVLYSLYFRRISLTKKRTPGCGSREEYRGGGVLKKTYSDDVLCRRRRCLWPYRGTRWSRPPADWPPPTSSGSPAHPQTARCWGSLGTRNT